MALAAAGVDTADRLGAMVPTGGEALGETFLELLGDAVRRFPAICWSWWRTRTC